jgi:bifunctional UDP-N-acetylglucosamine pyrophosphorylase/glucosamine-1-phosphate N-acetyltransferase
MSALDALHIIILAAGRGKRMHTRLPKVLHRLAGVPLLKHVLNTAKTLNATQIHVVVGHEALQIQQQLHQDDLNWVHQTEQLGTGHAVMQALPFIPDHAKVLILSGDVPLIQASTLQEMIEQPLNDLTLMVAHLPQPFGFGRITRNADGQIRAIVEEKDASPEQKSIREIYTGICCAQAKHLKNWLPQLSTKNAQKEYYLTEIIQHAVNSNVHIQSLEPKYLFEIQGINTLNELQALERTWQQHLAKQLLESGVHVSDLHRIDIRGQLNCASDVFIDINVIFEDNVHIESGSFIGAHSILKNCTIGKNCIIHPHSILQDCVIEENCEIGPFARCRPGTQLGPNCKIGNFVETKNSRFEQNSKANHLSYIGDAQVGKFVNIGAGTITCNYDGVEKHQTIIKDHAFIGSDTQLIAPVIVGEHAVIGAGTSLREDAPAHALTLSPNRQRSIAGWQRRSKKISSS